MVNVICELFYWLLGILTRPFGLTHVFENLKPFQGSRIARLQGSLSKRVELAASGEDSLVRPGLCLIYLFSVVRVCLPEIVYLYFLGPVLA